MINQKTQIMARVNKNGNLSGAVGNIVFVNRYGETHARRKPGKVNQTSNTKKSASGFGNNSSQDRLVRAAITEKIDIRNYQCFAVNHRTRLGLTIFQSQDEDGNTQMRYENPQSMVGTIFNNNWQWERAVNFYPDYNLPEDNSMMVIIPELNLGKQIKLPKNATRAILKLHALTIDPNKRVVMADILSSLTFDLDKNQNVPSQEWQFQIPENTYWALIIATISYSSPKNNIAEEHMHTGTYLWAKKIAE